MTAGGSRPGLLPSSKTIKNAHGLLSTVLASAVEAGKIPGNVARGIGIPDDVREENVFLTGPELARLVAEVKPYWQPLVTFLAGTGLRWSEATALQWGEVDLDSEDPAVRVLRSWKRAASGPPVIGPPKTSRGRRTVFLAPELAEMLRAMRRHRSMTTPLVFTTPGPNFAKVSHQNFYPRVWQPAVAAFAGDVTEAYRTPSGILKCRVAVRGPGKHPRVHDLRHSYASAQIAAGVPLPALQRAMGHESITTTIDVYGHLEPQEGRKLAAAASTYLTYALPRIVEPAATGSPLALPASR